jgi:hypothetical protein
MGNNLQEYTALYYVACITDLSKATTKLAQAIWLPLSVLKLRILYRLKRKGWIDMDTGQGERFSSLCCGNIFECHPTENELEYVYIQRFHASILT